MKVVLEKYLGRTVGVNLEKTHHIDAAELVAVGDESFSVDSSVDGHLHHVMYTNVVQVIEDPAGVEVRHLFTANERFNLIIKIGHIVAYVAA